MKFIRSLAAGLALILIAGQAEAHTTIVASNIEDGGEMSVAPEIFRFSFGDDVGLAGLDLETLAGEPIAIGFERPSAMSRDFSVPLPSLGPDVYVLKWRAIAKDGHVMRGELAFTVTG